MLWKTLFNRLDKQPLSFTNHNHVYAIIDDQRVELDLKYDAQGHPYLVKAGFRYKKNAFKPGDRIRNTKTGKTGCIIETMPDPRYYKVKYGEEPIALSEEPIVIENAERLEKR